MKPVPKRKESDARGERQIKCLDAMNRHRSNATVMAGLLEHCKPGIIDGELVAEAGVIIREELEQVQAWTRQLEKELRSK
jgi:hypothetical protein